MCAFVFVFLCPSTQVQDRRSWKRFSPNLLWFKRTKLFLFSGGKPVQLLPDIRESRQEINACIPLTTLRISSDRILCSLPFQHLLLKHSGLKSHILGVALQYCLLPPYRMRRSCKPALWPTTLMKLNTLMSDLDRAAL